MQNWFLVKRLTLAIKLCIFIQRVLNMKWEPDLTQCDGRCQECDAELQPMNWYYCKDHSKGFIRAVPIRATMYGAEFELRLAQRYRIERKARMEADIEAMGED